MSNVLENIRNSINDVIEWLHQALDTTIVLAREGKVDEAALLAEDVRMVVTSFLNVAVNFIPSHSIEPIPGNFWKKLSWLAKHFTLIQTLVILTSGVNPFEEAREKAKAIATKWGFSQ